MKERSFLDGDLKPWEVYTAPFRCERLNFEGTPQIIYQGRTPILAGWALPRPFKNLSQVEKLTLENAVLRLQVKGRPAEVYSAKVVGYENGRAYVTATKNDGSETIHEGYVPIERLGEKLEVGTDILLVGLVYVKGKKQGVQVYQRIMPKPL